MLKKLGLSALVVMVVALGVAGVVLAQEPTPPADEFTPPGPGFGGEGHRGGMMEPVAEVLGMTAEEFFAAVEEGQTMAEIAAAQGIELSEVVDALVAPRVEQMEQAVADGYLTQAQAEQMIEFVTEFMTWRFENLSLGTGMGKGIGMGMGMGGFGGHGRHGGFGGRGGCGGGRWGSAPEQQAPPVDTGL